MNFWHPIFRSFIVKPNNLSLNQLLQREGVRKQWWLAANETQRVVFFMCRLFMKKSPGLLKVAILSRNDSRTTPSFSILSTMWNWQRIRVCPKVHEIHESQKTIKHPPKHLEININSGYSSIWISQSSFLFQMQFAWFNHFFQLYTSICRPLRSRDPVGLGMLRPQPTQGADPASSLVCLIRGIGFARLSVSFWLGKELSNQSSAAASTSLLFGIVAMAVIQGVLLDLMWCARKTSSLPTNPAW